MKRLLAVLAVMALVAGVNFAMHALALPDPPKPLAIDDPETGEVILWPGSYAAPRPQIRFALETREVA